MPLQHASVYVFKKKTKIQKEIQTFTFHLQQKYRI